MDRLARNVEDMLRLVRELNRRGGPVEFVKESVVFTADNEDPRSALMFTMLAVFAQFERSLIKERQREGIALAKAKGNVYTGRKLALSPEQVTTLRQRLTEGVNKSTLAKELGIRPETLCQYIKSVQPA